MPTQEEIYSKVSATLVEALNVDEDDLRKGMRTFVEATRTTQVATPA